MKKVFLSLAALAFVATGAVSCSSDDGGNGGSNDDTPGQNDDTPGEGDDTPGDGDDTPGAEGSSFVYNGTTYTLEKNVFVIQGSEEEGAQLSPYNYEDGGESYVVSEWFLEAFPEFEQGSQPTHFMRIYFDVEAHDNGDGTYSLNLPNQAENIFPYQVMTIANGQILTDSGYDYGNITLDFNSFVLGDTTLEVNYQGADSNVSFSYDGASGVVFDNWTEGAGTNSVSSVSNSPKMRQAHTNVDLNLSRK